jgi:hypothetical protein
MKTLRFALLMLFALNAAAATPQGWIVAGSAPNDYEIGVDDKSAAGQKSGYIKAKPTAAATGFGTLMQMIAADDYRGGRWKLSARVRTEGAKAQLWMRVDGPDGKMNAFDNMGDRPITGDTQWKQYEVVLDVAPDSAAVAFGVLLAARGEVWVDDFKLERVTTATPLTGKDANRLRAPVNLDFED